MGFHIKRLVSGSKFILPVRKSNHVLNVGLIGNLLTLPRHMTRIYFPPDANCAVSVMDHCLRSKDYVNLVSGYRPPPCYTLLMRLPH